MPYYEFNLEEPERAERIARRHGLKNFPTLAHCTEPSLAGVGHWQTLLMESTGTDDSGSHITIFLHQLPGIEILSVGDKVTYGEPLRARRAKVLSVAHGIGHLLCERMWWYKLAERFYPYPNWVKQVEDLKPCSRTEALYWKTIYWINPIEICARAYATATWRQYYRAVYGIGYVRDQIGVLLRPTAERFERLLKIDSTMLARLSHRYTEDRLG